MSYPIHIRRIGAGLAVAMVCSGAQAHGVVGERFFPATITTDDPFAADEMALRNAAPDRMASKARQ